MLLLFTVVLVFTQNVRGTSRNGNTSYEELAGQELLCARSDPLVPSEFDVTSPNWDISLSGMTKKGVGGILGRTGIALASSPESLCIHAIQLPL